MGHHDGDVWDELGQITISFRSRIGESGERHFLTSARSSTGADEVTWPGIASPELAAWLARQVGIFVPSSGEQPVADHPASHHPLDVEFVDLTLSPSSDAGGQQKLRASGRLRFYRHLEEECGPSSVLIEFHLVNLESHQSRVLAAERTEIRPGELAREVVRDLPIPGAGRYEIKAMVRELPSGPLMAESRGAILRVEP
jgi:hypothetical protein